MVFLAWKAVQKWREVGIIELIRQIFKLAKSRSAHYLPRAKQSLQVGRPAAAIGYITELFFWRNLYIMWLESRAENGIVLRSVRNGKFDMYLDTQDKGISKQLISRGWKEAISSTAYQNQLQSLATETDDRIIILDVGANLGYYALLAGHELGDQATIYAFEPSPSNAQILRKNVELNDFEDIISIQECAVGDSDGNISFRLSNKSNLGHVVNDPPENDESIITVELVSIDNFLLENEIPPEDVDVVRMDTQGAEAMILEGMTSVIDSESKLLFYIETHPHLVDDKTHKNVISALKSAGFKIVASDSSHDMTEIQATTDTDHITWESPSIMNEGYELVLRR